MGVRWVVGWCLGGRIDVVWCLGRQIGGDLVFEWLWVGVWVLAFFFFFFFGWFLPCYGVCGGGW